MSFAITPQIYLLCGQKMSPLKLNDVKFIDKDLKEEYDNDKLIKDTKIKNGTKLIIL